MGRRPKKREKDDGERRAERILKYEVEADVLQLELTVFDL